MRQLRPLLASVVVAAAVAAAATVAVPAMASATTLPQSSFDVQIFDRTEGRLLPTYQYQGRTYVIGKPGNEYSISLRNRGGERMMAVTSVDGVNIVSGQTASAMQSGYVLSPWQTADIAGWRKSLDNTAAFYFTDLGDSYAARTGRPNNVGVIGVAVFRERRVAAYAPPVVPSPRYRSDEQRYPSSAPSEMPSRADATNDGPGSPPSPPASSSGAGSLSGEARSSNNAQSPSQSSQQSQPSQSSQSGDSRESYRAEKSLGTGHGRIEDSRTRYTDFQRASSTPDQVITIQYDTYNNLAAIGVPVWRDGNDERYSRRDPRPFPRDPTLGFVPDPSRPRY